MRKTHVSPTKTLNFGTIVFSPFLYLCFRYVDSVSTSQTPRSSTMWRCTEISMTRNCTTTTSPSTHTGESPRRVSLFLDLIMSGAPPSKDAHISRVIYASWAVIVERTTRVPHRMYVMGRDLTRPAQAKYFCFHVCPLCRTADTSRETGAGTSCTPTRGEVSLYSGVVFFWPRYTKQRSQSSVDRRMLPNFSRGSTLPLVRANEAMRNSRRGVWSRSWE